MGGEKPAAEGCLVLRFGGGDGLVPKHSACEFELQDHRQKGHSGCQLEGSVQGVLPQVHIPGW